jgi:hypothetical protein
MMAFLSLDEGSTRQHMIFFLFLLIFLTSVGDTAFGLQCRQEVKWFQNNGHVYPQTFSFPHMNF